MNLVELAILYLACGAPFGVYYFFSAKHQPRDQWFVAKLGASFLFWFYFAARFVIDNGRFRYFFDSDTGRRVVSDFETRKMIDELRRDFENALFAADADFRVYEFREAFERYVGLSLELDSADCGPTDALINFGAVSGYGKNAQSSRCLQRRNLERLRYHRERARSSVADKLEPAFAAIDHRERLHSYFDRLIGLVRDDFVRAGHPRPRAKEFSQGAAGVPDSARSNSADNLALDRAA